MRKLILAAAILAIAGIAPCLARGGHGHRHGHGLRHHSRIHGPSRDALSAPADPSVPPALSSNAGFTGSAALPSRRKARSVNTPARARAPENLDTEDAKLDQRIKSICRGC
jgi:hypothetical protein